MKEKIASLILALVVCLSLCVPVIGMEFHTVDSVVEKQSVYKNSESLHTEMRNEEIPKEFDDYFLAFTFAILLVDVIYMSVKKKWLIEGKQSSALAILVVNATIILCLHYAIFRTGWALALNFDMQQDQRFLAKVGESTKLMITPILYFVLIWQCIDIRVKQREQVSDPPLEDDI